MRYLIASLLLLLTPYSQAEPHQQVFQSGIQQTVMVELYTSEGCNSCPPAETFLNRYIEHPQLWQRFIPLAFHVDYWDYLGWRDRFAKPAHAERQRDYARVLRARTIYTPEFFVNGREWRRGFLHGQPEINPPAAGALRATLSGQQLEVGFMPQAPLQSPFELHVAMLGMGLQTRIQAGENAGRNATHHFVVLEHFSFEAETPHWTVTLPQLPINKQPGRHALVVWISKPGQPAPLQAVGGYLRN